MKVFPVIACLLLAALVYLGVEDRQYHQKAEAELRANAEKHKALIESGMKAIAEIEGQRAKILSDLVNAMDDPDTKSIYHQIYHTNRAQLKMQSLSVQEQQMIAGLILSKI